MLPLLYIDAYAKRCYNEKVGSPETKITPEIIQTDKNNVTVRLFRDEDLEEFSHLFKKDLSHIRAHSYGLDVAGFVTWAEDIVEGNPPSGVRLMMVCSDDKIAGCIVLGTEQDGTQNIAYAAGKDYEGQGVMSSAVKAVVDDESKAGRDVIAQVKRDNLRSTRLLGRVGFKFDHWDFEFREEVYKYAHDDKVKDN